MKKHNKNSSKNNHKMLKKRKYKNLEQKERELILWFRRYLDKVRDIGQYQVKHIVSCVFIFLFLTSFSIYSDEKKTVLQIDTPNGTILGPIEVNEGDGAYNGDSSQTLDMLNFKFPDVGNFGRKISINKAGVDQYITFYRNTNFVSDYEVMFTIYNSRSVKYARYNYGSNYYGFGVEYLGVIWNCWKDIFGGIHDEHRGDDEDMTVWRVPKQTVDFVTSTFGNSFESRNNKAYRFSSPKTFLSGIEYFYANDNGYFDKNLSCSIDDGFASIQVYPEAYYNDVPNSDEGRQTYRIGWQLKSVQHCADTTRINRFNIYLVNVDVYKDYTPPEIADIRLTNANNSASISLANKRLFFTPYQTNIIRYTTYDNMQGTLWSKPRFSTLDISYYNGTQQVSLLQKSFTNWGEVSSGQFSLPFASFDYNISLYLEDGSSDVLPATGEEQGLYVAHNFTLKYLNSYPSISISTTGVYIARDGSQYLYIKSRVNAYDLRKEVFMLVIPTGSNTYKRCILAYDRKDENDLPLYKIESVENITTSDWTSIDFPRYTPYNSCGEGFEKYMYGDGFLPLSEIFNVCGSSVPQVYFRAMVIDPAWWGGDWTSSSEQAKHRVRTNWITIPLNWVKPTIKITGVALSEDKQKINIQYEARDDNECEIMYSVSARRYGYPDFQPLAEDKVFKRTFNTTDVNEVFSYQYPFEGEYYIQLKIKDNNVYDPTYQGLIDYTTWWYIAVDTVSPNIDLSFKQSGGVNGYFEVTGQAEVGFPLEVYASLDGSNYVFISSYTPWWSYYPYQYRTQNKVNDFYIPISSIREKLGYLSSCPLKLKIVSSDGLNPQSVFEKEVFYDADRPLFEKVYSPPKNTNDNNLVYLSGSVIDNKELARITYEIYKFTEDNMHLIDDHKLEISGSSCSYTAPVLLLPYEDQYLVRISIEDKAGNVNTYSYYVSYDTTPPIISNIASQQRQGPSGYFVVEFKDRQRRFEGLDKVEVYYGDILLYQQSGLYTSSVEQVDNNTSVLTYQFSIPIFDLKQKIGQELPSTISCVLRCYDKAGNVSNNNFVLNYGKESPEFYVLSKPDTYTNKAENFSVNVPNAVKLVYELLKNEDGRQRQIELLELSTNTFSRTINFSSYGEGLYIVRLQAETDKGAVDNLYYYVTYDTTPPSSAVVKKTKVFAGKVQIQFECEVSANIKIYDDTGECLFDATSQGFNYFEKLMKLGKHNLAIVLRDLAGNVTTSYHLVEVKQAIPINTQLPTLYGNELTCVVSAEPGCTLQLVDSFGIVLATAPVDYYGRALFQNVRLPRGENTLKYVSIDLAGNRVESEPFKVTVVQMRPLPPELVQIEPMTLNGTELVITQNDFVIKGKTYPNVPVIILLNGEVFQVVTSTTDGTFEYKVDKVIENGEYYLQVKVYKDGLESNPSPPIKFVLASLDPSLQQLEIVLWQKNAYEGSTILIRVYDKTTGQPVSGAKVVVQDEEYVTDAEGFAGKRGSPIHRGVKIKPNYNRQVASALRRTIGFASTTDDSFDTENEITIYAVIEEGTYKKYGTKKVVLLKQDRKNLFLSPNNDGINDIVAVKNLHNPVKIFDLRGRLVRTLYNDNGTIYWDGRDENGQPLPSGVIFI